MIKNRQAVVLLLILGCMLNALSGCTDKLISNNAAKENTSFSMKDISEIPEGETEEKKKNKTEEETKEETEEESTEESTGEKVGQGENLFLSLSTANGYAYDESSSKQYSVNYQKIYINSNTNFDSPKLMREDVPALSAALDEYNKTEEQTADEYVQKFKEYAAADDSDRFEYTSDIYVQRADKQVLSIRNESFEYTGGIHGMSATVGYNYDTATGKELAIDDVVKDTKLLSDILYDKLMDKYGEETLSLNSSEKIDQMIEDESLFWTIGYDRMTCYFGLYTIASYAEGILSVDIAFEEYPELFESKYMNIPESYVLSLSWNKSQDYDLDGDGTDETISFSCDSDESGWMTRIEVSVGDKKAGADGELFEAMPALVHLSDGRNYIYIETDEMNDYGQVHIFDVSKTPEYVGSMNGGGMSWGAQMVSYQNDDTDECRTVLFTDPDSIEWESTCGLLGTHGMYKIYHVTDGDMPVSDDEVFLYSYPFQITSKIELTLKNKDGEEKMLPAGTVFDVLYTDSETYAGIRTGSEVYLLHIEFKDDPESGQMIKKVDGVDLVDAFDGIVYAG